MGRANRSLDIADELVDLVDAGDDVGPHLLGVRVPGIAELPEIPGLRHVCTFPSGKPQKSFF